MVVQILDESHANEIRTAVLAYSDLDLRKFEERKAITLRSYSKEDRGPRGTLELIYSSPHDGTINVELPLFDKLTNKLVIAFLILHEFGHLINDDANESYQKQEDNATEFAVKKLMEKGSVDGATINSLVENWKMSNDPNALTQRKNLIREIKPHLSEEDLVDEARISLLTEDMT